MIDSRWSWLFLATRSCGSAALFDPILVVIVFGRACRSAISWTPISTPRPKSLATGYWHCLPFRGTGESGGTPCQCGAASAMPLYELRTYTLRVGTMAEAVRMTPIRWTVRLKFCPPIGPSRLESWSYEAVHGADPRSLRVVRRVTQLDPHLDDGVSFDHEPVLCGPHHEASQVAYGPHSGWQLHS